MYISPSVWVVRIHDHDPQSMLLLYSERPTQAKPIPIGSGYPPLS